MTELLGNAPTARASGRSAAGSLDALLRFAWEADVFTAGDALGAVGLSRSTTIEAIDDLVPRLVRELPNARAVGDYRKGRPRAVRAARRRGASSAVDAGGALLVTTVADLRGRPLATTDLAVSTGTRRPSTGARGGRDRCRPRRGGRHARRRAVGVRGCPRAGGRGGRLTGAPGRLLGPDEPDLVGLLSPWAPIVRVENDACSPPWRSRRGERRWACGTP